MTVKELIDKLEMYKGTKEEQKVLDSEIIIYDSTQEHNDYASNIDDICMDDDPVLIFIERV